MVLFMNIAMIVCMVACALTCVGEAESPSDVIDSVSLHCLVLQVLAVFFLVWHGMESCYSNVFGEIAMLPTGGSMQKRR